MELFDYQIDAVRRMKNGCILCGDVGSGKSLTSIAYYLMENGVDIFEQPYPKIEKLQKLIIITTAQKRDKCEWDGDLTKYGLSTSERDIVINSWNNIQKYVDEAGCFFIFDEQRVVGSGAWVKSFLKIASNNSWVLLSATPGDTWSDYIPVFIANGFYKNRTEFIREHVVYKRFVSYPVIDRYVNTGRLCRLRKDILIDMNYNCPNTLHHKVIETDYDVFKYKELVKTKFDSESDDPIESASKLCQKLRQIVNEDISKRRIVESICTSNKRVIIFYNFDYELDILKSLNYSCGTEIAEWNGHQHQFVPKSDRWAYLVNYAAGAEGWNCILTDTMIFFSESYSYRCMKQASGRINRLNSPYKDLYYYHLRSKASIDISIAKALNDKKTFNEKGFYESLDSRKNQLL